MESIPMAELNAVAPAAVNETHIGVVFLVGDRAYKLKKPVDLGFLDFSTREKRLEACRREVELNSRFAPDVYLGVADVHGLDGEPCDHLVVMRRMPLDRRLSALVRAGHPVDGPLREVARSIAVWHARAPRGPEISIEATADALRGRWTDSFDQVRPFHGTVLDRGTAEEIERLTLRYLAGRGPLFERRIQEGRIVDGHGDLLTNDIFCLDDGPRILDCLEFDDRLRHLDGLEDAAFLAMDLERLGAGEAAEHFIGWYCEYSGDPAPASLYHHFVANRAFIRAKVACLRAAQSGEDPAHPATAKAVADARTLSELTLRHLNAAAVRLVLVGGLPGTGKSSLAGGLADLLGFTLLSSDRVRKELVGIPAEQSAAATFGTGIYDSTTTEATYSELLSRAGRLLGLGESVVIDASWISARHRSAAAELAVRTDSDLVELRCEAPANLAVQRIRDRLPGASDAHPAVAAAMSTAAEPWPEAYTVDTTGSLQETVDHVLDLLRPYGTQNLWRARPTVRTTT